MAGGCLYPILALLYATIWLTHFTHSPASPPVLIVNMLYFILLVISTNSVLDILLILALAVPSLIPLLYTLRATRKVSSLEQSTPVAEAYARSYSHRRLTNTAVLLVSRAFDTYPNTGHHKPTPPSGIFSQLLSFLQPSFLVEVPYGTKPAKRSITNPPYDEYELDLEQGRGAKRPNDNHDFFHTIPTRAHGDAARCVIPYILPDPRIISHQIFRLRKPFFSQGYP